MYTERILSRKKLGFLALPAGALVLALSGCSGPNYSGSGNEFIVHGRVTDPGQRSLKADIYRIDEAYGAAEDWLMLNSEHQIHDNCQCNDGTWSVGRLTVGEVYDMRGNLIEPSNVAVGTCVRFTGKIRASSEGKTDPERPVYQYAQVESCPKGLE